MDGPGDPLMGGYGPEDTFRLRIKTSDWVRQGYIQIPQNNASNCCHSDGVWWWLMSMGNLVESVALQFSEQLLQWVIQVASSEGSWVGYSGLPCIPQPTCTFVKQQKRRAPDIWKYKACLHFQLHGHYSCPLPFPPFLFDWLFASFISK